MTWCKKCRGKGAIKRDYESMVGCNATDKGAVICGECHGSGYDEAKLEKPSPSNEEAKPEPVVANTPDWMEDL